jgi:molybdopterin/thiamine biosynthesis adenylyltransferase
VIWWTSQPSRARNERSAIAELEETVGWLQGVTWRLTDTGVLCADFELTILGEPVTLELSYPGIFPDVPPQIRPKDKVRLSGHQYGAGGELCLEYRPDNWEPDFTGAMLVQSAYRLLSGEQPAVGETAEVASAHRTTIAQDARSSTFRFLVSAEAREAILDAPMQSPMEADIVEHYASSHWLAFPRRFGEPDNPRWTAATSLPDYRVRKTYLVRLGASLAKHIAADYEFLETLAGVMDSEEVRSRVAEFDEELAFILECGGEIRLMSIVAGSGKRVVLPYRTVVLPATANRLPPEYARLAEASVAIFGCGSMGSKVAASLARAGIGKIVLIDGDILLPDNLVRNDLDWDGVGLNKPDGVKRRIRKIAPSTNVVVRRMAVGGQESAASTDDALTLAGNCDVIIDATADPVVFNLCAAVARNERKVLIWGEVFAGGIGGMITRLRPDLDPVPHAARRQITDWCADRGKAPPLGSEEQYGLILSEGGPPLVADDADVTVVAGHVAKMALDALVNLVSIFPQSAYAVGLGAGWIFEGPFDTWPIELKVEGEWGPPVDENLSEELGAFVAEFFPKTADGQTG